MRSQPLIPLALLFAAGIVAARAFAFGPAPLIVALVLGAGLLVRFPVWGAAWLAASLGATLYWARYEPFSEDDLRVLLAEEPIIATVRGNLAETPQIRDFDETGISTARLRVTGILLNEEWRPARGEIMTRTRGELDTGLFYDGQQVEAIGVIQPPRARRAPGLFDQREYLRNQRIFYQLDSESPNHWKIVEHQPMPILEKLRRWAKRQLGRGLPEDEPTRMLWAMTLGWKTALSGEMAAPFMRTGTAHIIAVSGLHVACIGFVLVAAMRLLGFGRPHYVWGVPALLWAYTAATGWQSSGIRSALMATVVLAGWAARRPAALLNSLAAAGLILLAFQPEQLFQTGFQLSFAVVGAIGAIVPFLEARLPMELRADPFLPRPLWPEWLKRFNRVTMLVRPNLRITLASFLGALPLTAYYFNLVTPVSLLANLVVVPLSSLALTFSMLSLALPFLSGILNFLAWAAMWETIEATGWFDRLGWHVYVPKPGAVPILIFLLLLILVVAGSSWPRRARFAAWAALMLAAVAALVALRPRPQLHILPVAGAPIYVDLPGSRHDLLIDCSNTFDFERVVRPFLRGQGVNRLWNLALSHGDIQHIGAFEQFVREFDPKRVFTGPHPSRSPADKRARAALAAAPDVWRSVARGDSLAAFEVLHPAPDRGFGRADDNAVVLRAAIEGWSVLCLSDLGPDGLRALTRAEEPLAADILILGAAANDPRLSEDLIHRVSPRLIVFDPGRYHAKAAPQTTAPLLLPDDCGAISFEFSPTRCQVRCANGRQLALAR